MRSFTTPHEGRLLTDDLDSFLLYGRVEGRSKRTLEIYDQAFQSFLDHVGEVATDDVTPAMIRSWLSAYLDAGYAKTTINMRLGHKETPSPPVRSLTRC